MTVAAEHLSNYHRDTPWWPEHRSRYRFAGGFVRNRVVLDVACGAGIGAEPLLEAGARSVLGVDSSAPALREASRAQVAGFRVLRAQATELPLDNGSIPAITSFETLEHLPEPALFLRELRRVISPDGILILSTPNSLHTKPEGGMPQNPFHLHEFTSGELSALLGDHFGDVAILGQRVHPTLRPCPFWERPDSLPRSLTGRLAVARWKTLNRLPGPTGERISRGLIGRQLYPSEADFVFERESIDSGHALVAVCRP